MTRRRVAEGNDKAKGIFLTGLSCEDCDTFPIGELDRGEGEGDLGLEKAMASRSSCSRP